MEHAQGLTAIGADEPQVLQIALTPAAVATQVIRQGRRIAFVAAALHRQQAHLIAGPVHQRRFDLVMTDDVTAEGRASRQYRQAAMPGERSDSDHGIVPPELAAVALPPSCAHDEDAHAVAMAELENASERVRVGQADREALYDADARIGLHDPHQAQNRLPSHEAVDVE